MLLGLPACVSDDAPSSAKTAPSHLFHNRADYRVLARPVSPQPMYVANVSHTPPMFAESMLVAEAGAAYAEYKRGRKEESAKLNCSLADRFDRSDELAYNFADGQTRLGLDIDIDGLDWGELGELEVEEIMLRFRYKFQKGKSAKEACRYNAPLQGFLCSLYNEMFVRDDETVWDEMDDRGLSFWRR